MSVRANHTSTFAVQRTPDDIILGGAIYLPPDILSRFVTDEVKEITYNLKAVRDGILINIEQKRCDICGIPADWVESYDIDQVGGGVCSAERHVCDYHRTLRIRAEDSDCADPGELVEMMREQAMDDAFDGHCGDDPEPYAIPLRRPTIYTEVKP